MRLITSPAHLSDDDLEAMGKGEELRKRLKEDLFQAIRTSIPGTVLNDRLQLVTWMVGTGRLQVRIALREHTENYSLFHEKIGVFSDSSDCWMTFTGSPNETMGGAVRHSESFPLHRSWAGKDQRAYAAEERHRFEEIWDERVDGIATWTVNDWIAEPMRQQFGSREPYEHTIAKTTGARTTVPPISEAKPDVTLPADGVSLLPAIPTDLRLHDFQRDAVNDWLRSGGHGTFAMATGTGKTVTALAAATQASTYAARRDRPLLVIVIVPLLDLVDQWAAEAERFGFRPAKCHGDLTKQELGAVKSAFSSVRSSTGQRTEMVITTAGSLTPQSSNSDVEKHFLQRQLARHQGLLMVIGDEMHALGTPPRLAALPVEPTFTLGLSATPKRHGDEVGTERLIDYFGAVVISISIKDAIYKYRALVPYEYRIERVDLTGDEAAQYRVISQRIAAAYAAGDDEAAERHIRARTRLIQHASNKLGCLRRLLTNGLAVADHQLVYVAEGKDPATDLAQLDEVESMMRHDFGMRVARYYGETDRSRRALLQDQLASGDLQALIAMKCLDEGVDIPSARTGVIMASTQNPRQFVQRRGRLLRRDPNGPKSHATIYDLLVLPERADASTDSEKRLLGAELSRAVELADAARNPEIRFQVIEWAYEYDLDPEEYDWMALTDGDDMQEWVS
ncbi:DEAD/DEAH box helicase family protein [Mycolicibacterium vaccae]|uniref:DEAD/DEAH box helicase family protein n=1 Tax=Mycolicibacterium vaccae TaxID=1810 RepID=UPI0013520851|nr:DEAD/DEAH box helicase family protein [Mycolicibacterium vaccae]